MTDSFDRQLARLRENYLLALKTRGKEAIHDYRVAIKRLKALFNLVESINPDFRAKKQFRRFRSLFKSSAQLRDLHIQMDIAGEFSTLPGFPGTEYLSFLRKRECKAVAKMEEFGEDFNFTRLEKKRKKIEWALQNTDVETAGGAMRTRFDSLLDKLTRKIEGREPEDREMHAVRILAKEFHYTGEILRECFPERLPDGENMFAKLKRVHQALGKWHDYEVAHAWLKRFWKKEKSFCETGGAEAVRYLGERKDALRNDFVRAWNDFLSAKSDPGTSGAERLPVPEEAP